MRDAIGLLNEISDIGRDPVRGGYSRHVFEPAELSLRDWFTRRSTEIGLSVSTDRNGNLWAWWGEPGPGAVITGSHLDSVPGGGAYDGPLGVVSALDAVGRMRAAGFEPSKPFAIVVFCEEEGSRFGVACLGSRLAAGSIAPSIVRELRDPSGTAFADAARSAGIDPDAIGEDPVFDSVGCFVELHVEQGRGLIDLGRPVAVATGILAHGRWKYEFGGEGNHAGATRMADRRDPVLAAARFALAARDLAARLDADENARATIGRAELVPGGTNVIASRATVWLDCRAENDDALLALVRRIDAAATEAAAAERCRVAYSEESFSPLVSFDPQLRDRIARALDDAPLLASGAGHDAGVLATRTRTAMIFVRNPTGVSHAPAEAAADEDCVAGVDALERVLRELL